MHIGTSNKFLSIASIYVICTNNLLILIYITQIIVFVWLGLHPIKILKYDCEQTNFF